MNMIERAFSRLMYGKLDYSLKKGDVVTSKEWWPSCKLLKVVDVNWALRAVALELAPGSIVVWPVGNVKKAEEVS